MTNLGEQKHLSEYELIFKTLCLGILAKLLFLSNSYVDYLFFIKLIYPTISATLSRAPKPIRSI